MARFEYEFSFDDEESGMVYVHQLYSEKYGCSSGQWLETKNLATWLRNRETEPREVL